MHRYNADELCKAQAAELFLSRLKGGARGGTNYIREKGDMPERAVRKLVSSLIGKQYRVTSGHLVKADGSKSRQIDIIIVKDVPAATLHVAEDGETELVRVEWVAAVGEVKASWSDHRNVIESYQGIVEDIETLQKGLLVKNNARFGEIQDRTTLEEMSRPMTGRPWLNRCFTFLFVLGQGRCRVSDLANDLAVAGISASDAVVLILDEDEGATLCLPSRLIEQSIDLGVASDVNLIPANIDKVMTWKTVQEEGYDAMVSSGRFLNCFITDLQLHLSTWFEQHVNPKHYSELNSMLKHRHPGEVGRI